MTPSLTGSSAPIAIPEKRLSLLDLGAEIERTHPKDSGDLGYIHSLMALVCLPGSDPGDVPLWETTNGSITLTVQPGVVRDNTGAVVDHGYPYGIIPRRVMLYLMSEAMRREEPQVPLGSSLRGFLKSVGTSVGGRNAALTTKQVRRLLASPMVLEDRRPAAGNRTRVTAVNSSMAASYQLLFSEGDDSGVGIGEDLESFVTLSPWLFEALCQSAAPMDMRAIGAMGSSPLKFDVMAWLTYRLPTLKAPVKQSWEELSGQFGGKGMQMKHFRAKFRDALQDALAVYGAAQVEEVPGGLLLRPSTPLVPRQERRLNGMKRARAQIGESKNAPKGKLAAVHAIEEGAEKLARDETFQQGLTGAGAVREALATAREKSKTEGTGS